MSTQGNAQTPQQHTVDGKDAAGKDSEVAGPSGVKFALLMVSAFAAMFLVSLDKLIISTAIPQITDTFHSKDDIGWYGTAYLLTNCAFQLVFGKLYKFLPVKSTFLVSLLLFEIGSALCGAAPNSIAFILGRAIAGLGAGGVLPGVALLPQMVIIVYAVPLQKRPKYQGVFGAVFGVSSVLGPTMGGAFTTHVTWRWCFYINLPIGGAVMILVFLLLHLPDQPGTDIGFKEKLRQANAPAFFCVVSGIVCLCLALQWGGTTYAWSNGRIIALFVLAFLLLIAFALLQVWLPDQAILPPRLFIQRSIAAGFWSSLCVGAHQTMFLYYLPLWFQVIQGKSAVESGIDLLPMVLVIAAVSIANGQLVSLVGYYTPSFIIGACANAIGAGLLTTLGIRSSEGKWIGYQILYGFGLGLASQAPNMAAQTVLPKQDVAIGASLMFFGQTLFGAVFVSVGQNVFSNQLATRLAGIPGIDYDPAQEQNTGATDILDGIDDQYRTAALQAYNDSLRVVFQVALCMACLAVPGALAMEWLTVKKKGSAPRTKTHDEEKKSAGEGVQSDQAASKTNTTPQDGPVIPVDKEAQTDKDATSGARTAGSSTTALNAQNHEETKPV